MLIKTWLRHSRRLRKRTSSSRSGLILQICTRLWGLSSLNLKTQLTEPNRQRIFPINFGSSCATEPSPKFHWTKTRGRKPISFCLRCWRHIKRMKTYRSSLLKLVPMEFQLRITVVMLTFSKRSRWKTDKCKKWARGCRKPNQTNSPTPTATKSPVKTAKWTTTRASQIIYPTI